MKRLFFLVLLFLLFNTGAPFSVLAAEKELTYREQNSNEDADLVFLTVGESIDLKFVGASDFKNYDWEWTTTDKSVAVVNRSGVVTAKKEGTAVVKMVIKNSPYISKGCMVIVGKQYDAIEIADEKNKTIQSLTLEKGKTKQLYAKNLNTYCSGTYSFAWVSDNPSVVSVVNGLVTAKNAGTATIRVQLKNLSTGDILPNVPLKITVPGKVSVTPTLTPTPVPTISATPMPTVAPSATPIPKDVVFVAEVLGDDKVKLVFAEPVTDISAADVHIVTYRTEHAVESISWNSAKTEAVLSLEDVLNSGSTYTLSVNGYEKKTTIKPVFSVPDRIVLVWESLSKTNKAYTQNPDMDLEIPTKLSVEIYAGEFDVTRTWEWSGYVEYKLHNTGNIAFDFCDDYLLFYDAGDKAMISADFTFTSGKKEYTVSSGIQTITADKVPVYRVTGALDFGFLPSSSTAMVDWKNPKQELIANDSVEYTVIARFADNYGYAYASDNRGVNESMGLHSIDDENTPFGALDWEISFDSTGNGFYIDERGSVTALEKTTNGMVLVKASGNDTNEATIGSFRVNVNGYRYLASITAQQTEIELSTDALEGHNEYVSSATIPLTLKDQYGELWKDYSDLDISISSSDMDASACQLENGQLVIDVSHMEPVSGKAVITISAENGKVKEKVTVSLKKPSYDRNDEIVVSGWELGEDMEISALPNNVYEVENIVRINPYYVSRTINVGIVYENIFVVANADKKYATNSCTVGDTYVSVTGPNNKSLSVVEEGKKGLGVRKDEDGNIELLTSYQTSFGKFYTLTPGEYTVTAVYIKEIKNDRVITVKKTQKISILSEVPEVSIGNRKTSLIEYLPTNKEEARILAAECMQILVNGRALDNLTVDHIESVGYSSKNGRFVVSGIDVWVPSTKNPSMLVKTSIKSFSQVFNYEE